MQEMHSSLAFSLVQPCCWQDWQLLLTLRCAIRRLLIWTIAATSLLRRLVLSDRRLSLSIWVGSALTKMKLTQECLLDLNREVSRECIRYVIEDGELDGHESSG